MTIFSQRDCWWWPSSHCEYQRHDYFLLIILFSQKHWKNNGRNCQKFICKEYHSKYSSSAPCGVLHTCDWHLNLSFFQQHCIFHVALWMISCTYENFQRSVKLATWELIYHSYLSTSLLPKHLNRCTLEEQNRWQIPGRRTWKEMTSCPQTQGVHLWPARTLNI